ncbi:hypothetical protein [Streptomyces sp. ID05-18]|uniref:hypothetical protein n=1 Tax=Streptomyces sp. ID05-18 TaxID=3028662 RepID=UPI0029B47127|nr:hypothetical protein [Streptomyces sp. ID05-18]MDX3484450.1 hypothetical protein [Streptomyces sp. ID05-18]
MPLLPAAPGQMPGEVRDTPGGRQLHGDVVPQGVQGDQQQIVAAHDLAHVGPAGPAGRPGRVGVRKG